MRGPTRASSRSMSGEVCADSPTVSMARGAATRHALRADITLILVFGRIVDAQFAERIVALATFAAGATVPSHGIHARQRQLERDVERVATCDHLRLAPARERRVNPQIVRETQRERTGHRRPKLWRGIGERVVRERTEYHAIDLRRRAVDAGLTEKHDVASRQDHVLVMRVRPE